MKKVIRKSEVSPQCPNCGQKYTVDVEVALEIPKGDFKEATILGALMLLTCKKCDYEFPHMRFTSGIDKKMDLIHEKTDFWRSLILAKKTDKNRYPGADLGANMCHALVKIPI